MLKNKIHSISLLMFLITASTIYSQTVLIEAEAFKDRGGWVLDQQSMHEMGSPYLLAHGLGTPVANASTNIVFPSTGKYRVWVRTKDWVAQWKAVGAPGKFKISINNQKLDTIFGTRSAVWAWQNGGIVNITNPAVQIQLCDLTGFEGRCDAIVLCKDTTFIPPTEANALAHWRSRLLGNSTVRNAGHFDLVVVGGGMAGISAAIGAARLGLSVALVQDRPEVGGNNSSQVRVGLCGDTNVSPFVNLGNLVVELMSPVTTNPDSLFNDQYRLNILMSEPNLSLFMCHRADSVTTGNQSIKSVIAQNVITAERIELFGTYFADCTGDGTIGALAGADYEIDYVKHMGNTNMWKLKQYNTPQVFPRCPWAIDLTNKPFPGRPGIGGQSGTSGISCLGGWFWESGFSHNPLTEVEYIRDYNFRAMYGAWDCVKNVDSLYANYKLYWAAYVSGKRESRRLLGDIQLNKADLTGSVRYPDGFVGIGWNIDLHVPDPNFSATFAGDEFLSIANHTSIKLPYYIPYRCLYSRNISNLFMAGRNISVTSEALGAVRVMLTTGMMGEVVGLAAGLCKKHNSMPRSLYTNYLNELKSYIYAGIPARGATFEATPIIEPDSTNLQILIDNTDSGCTFNAPWPTSVYTTGYIGANYCQDGTTTADPAKWAKWTPQIPISGNYRIFMNWTQGGNRPINAPLEIHHADSISHMTIDQTNCGGIWNYLGTYRFATGATGYVKLLASAAGATIADAVIFERIGVSTGIGSVLYSPADLYVCGGTAAPVLKLDLKKDARVSLSIYSLCGNLLQQIVSEQTLSANRYAFPLKKDNLQKGIYIVRLFIDGKQSCCTKAIIN